MKKKKLPMRKCIITNKMYLKRDLLRIVKNKDGEILVDSTGCLLYTSPSPRD